MNGEQSDTGGRLNRFEMMSYSQGSGEKKQEKKEEAKLERRRPASPVARRMEELVRTQPHAVGWSRVQSIRDHPSTFPHSNPPAASGSRNSSSRSLPSPSCVLNRRRFCENPHVV